MIDFPDFAHLVRRLAPKTAVVLGTGLEGVVAACREAASIAFARVPGLSPPTVEGHPGRVSLGVWDEVPVLIFRGRSHLYEGCPADALGQPWRLTAAWGVRTFVLTNAAGGINPALGPGSLMVIRRHMKLLDRKACQVLARERDQTTSRETDSRSPYSPRLIESIVSHEAAAGRTLLAGVYAAVTGPCYETPAEIRALAVCGVDVAGMSTALEAEAAAELGLEVVGLSCVTNAAAGLSARPLDHAEVVRNAHLGIERLGEIVRQLVMGRLANPPASQESSPRCPSEF